MAIEGLGRLSTIDSNEPALCQMALEQPALLAALVSALSELPLGGSAEEATSASLHVPPSYLQEAAVEALVTLTNGTSLQLRLLLASDRMLMPRLLKLMISQGDNKTGQGNSQGIAAHVARRAAQIVSNLADSPECHDSLRIHEWIIAHIAWHDTEKEQPVGRGYSERANPKAESIGFLMSEVLELLSER